MEEMWCKLGWESFEEGLAELASDVDVLRVIDQISQSKVRDELHIYLEHAIDIPELLPMPSTLQPPTDGQHVYIGGETLVRARE